MRFETSALTATLALASANIMEEEIGNSIGSASHLFHHEVASEELLSEEQVEFAFQPSKTVLENTPLTSTSELGASVNGMESTGTVDTGLLMTTNLIPEDDAGGAAESPLEEDEMFGRELESLPDSCGFCDQFGDVVYDNEGLYNAVYFCDRTNQYFDSYCVSKDIPMTCWNVENVTDMTKLLSGLRTFNEELNCWNVSQVTKMNQMFRGAHLFNQDLSGWDVSGVTDMDGMFYGAAKFNSDINEWDVSTVNSTLGMFRNATTFNQCLGTWPLKTTSLENSNDMFILSGCPYTNAYNNATTWCQDATYGCSNTLPKSFSKHQIVRAENQDGEYAKVTTLKPFGFETFFEASDENNIALELFVKVPPGSPCTAGEPLDKSKYRGSKTKMESTGNATTIYKAEFVIEDILTIKGYDENLQIVTLCARAAKKVNFDTSTVEAEYVSVVDTVIKATIDWGGEFDGGEYGEFSKDVIIETVEEKTYEQSVSAKIAVSVMLCAPFRTADSTYKMGEEFGLCVRPTQEFIDEGYRVTGFKSVVCSNADESRILIEQSVVKETALTRVIDGSVAFDTNGDLVGRTAAGFVSLITAGFVANGRSQFTCTGKVSLATSTTPTPFATPTPLTPTTPPATTGVPLGSNPPTVSEIPSEIPTASQKPTAGVYPTVAPTRTPTVAPTRTPTNHPTSSGTPPDRARFLSPLREDSEISPSLSSFSFTIGVDTVDNVSLSASAAIVGCVGALLLPILVTMM